MCTDEREREDVQPAQLSASKEWTSRFKIQNKRTCCTRQNCKGETSHSKKGAGKKLRKSEPYLTLGHGVLLTAGCSRPQSNEMSPSGDRNLRAPHQ